jgi:hypothetical protein
LLDSRILPASLNPFVKRKREEPPVKGSHGAALSTGREPIRAPAPSVANVESHQCAHDVSNGPRHIVQILETLGARALNPEVGFPMPRSGKPWVVPYKTVPWLRAWGKRASTATLSIPGLGIVLPYAPSCWIPW